MNYSYVMSFSARCFSNLEIRQPISAADQVAIATTRWMDEDLAIHEQALRDIGSLSLGEIYGYVPALQLGGVVDVRHMKRVKAAEHWLFLAQLGSFVCDEMGPPGV